MTLLMIGGLLLGATLGLRFKVLALVPVALIGLFGIAVLAGLHGSTTATTAVAMVGSVICLQIGYFFGLLI